MAGGGLHTLRKSARVETPGSGCQEFCSGKVVHIISEVLLGGHSVMRVLDELPKTRSQPSLEAWVREDDRQTPVGTDRAWRLLFSTTI